MLELPLWYKGCPLVKMPWREIQRRRWGARRRSIHWPFPPNLLPSQTRATTYLSRTSSAPESQAFSLLGQPGKCALYARPLSPDIAEVPLLFQGWAESSTSNLGFQESILSPLMRQEIWPGLRLSHWDLKKAISRPTTCPTEASRAQCKVK